MLVVGLLAEWSGEGWLLEGALQVCSGLVPSKLIFVLPQAWGIMKSCDPPCKIARAYLRLGHAIRRTSTLQWLDVFVHSSIGASQPVHPRCVGIMVWAWLLARLAVVAVVDVATTGAAIVLILVDAVRVCLGCSLSCHAGLKCIEVDSWLHITNLLLHLVPGFLLPVFF